MLKKLLRMRRVNTSITGIYLKLKGCRTQYHNFTLWEVYCKLRDAKVSVHSVGTDAFTIESKDEEKARRVLGLVLKLVNGELANMMT